MCGRIANQVSEQERRFLSEREPFLSEYWSPTWMRYRSYDVRPTTKVPILMPMLESHGSAQVQAVRWGWRPSWMKGPLINARWETALEKSTFRQAVRERRCVVPAVAYYEWRRDAKDKPQAKYAFVSAHGQTLLLAGLQP